MATAKKKTVKRKKKRTLSPAQKAALARGRKKMMSNRKKKTTPRKKVSYKKKKTPVKKRSVIIINQGENMKGSRKRRKTSRRKTRKYSRRRVSRYMGKFSSRSMKTKIQTAVIDATVGTAAAIGTGYLVSSLPFKDDRVRAAMPFFMGVMVMILAKGKHADLMKKAANGMLITGGLALVRQFAPQYALAGESSYNMPLMGIPSDYMGIPTDYMGQNEDAFSLDENDLF